MLYLEVLKNRNFTYLLIGNFLRRSCFVLFSLQIIWFTVELTNQSSLKLSMMVMSQTLPFIIFGIFGGAYSECGDIIYRCNIIGTWTIYRGTNKISCHSNKNAKSFDGESI
ncbi:Macrolide-efflux protein [Staphylococcus aureus]|nr:hypothetical protein T909_01365 [Staphylococcus aureus UCIM6080]CAC6187151.1 Macrolide-efflux protein [Staphylococcus aureus]